MIKKLVKKHLESFAYFYTYLRHRIFVIVLLSFAIGILDGFGLTMFLPLLQLVSESSEINPDSMGKLKFLLDIFNDLGIPLTLVSVLILMLLFFIGKGIVQYIAGLYNVRLMEWFIKKLRIQNIKGLHKLAYKYFVTADVGRIQNTLTGEVDRVANSYANYFKAFQYAILVLVYMGFAYTIDAQFALLVTFGGLLSNYLYRTLYKNTKTVSRTLTGESNKFQSFIIQYVNNFKYLKATGGSAKYINKLRESIIKIQKSNLKIGQLDALLSAGREPILIAIVVAVILIQTTFLGGDLGSILISLIFFYRALGYLMQMQIRYNKFIAYSGSLENMTKFGKELRAHREKKNEGEIIGEINNLELMNVKFSYDNTVILKDINLNIQQFETVAFVGESGSGKTTLVNIIAGLLPIDMGDYLVNGNSIVSLNLEYLQNKIGYITQDPVIFSDTLFNNITFWGDNNEINRKRFWKVAKQAAIFEFINELPDKENSILGNNGVNLSGGQRQRISIARELFKEVEILILDEATSALDSETEKAIQQNIDELKGKYTILIVAHRISTIKNADRIVVMKNGKISKVDSFSQLLTSSSYFKKLVELQEI